MFSLLNISVTTSMNSAINSCPLQDFFSDISLTAVQFPNISRFPDNWSTHTTHFYGLFSGKSGLATLSSVFFRHLFSKRMFWDKWHHDDARALNEGHYLVFPSVLWRWWLGDTKDTLLLLIHVPWQDSLLEQLDDEKWVKPANPGSLGKRPLKQTQVYT